MKNTMMVTAALMTAFSASSVMANEVDGFYLGGAIGTTGIDDGDLYHSNVTVDTDDATFKVIAGYQFNRIVGIEAQYTKYGDVVAKLANPALSYTWAPTALSLSANLGYTFENGVRPFGTIGLSAIDLNQSSNQLQDDSGSGVRVGMGVEYTPASYSNMSFRVGYEADVFVIESGSNNGVDNDVTIDSFYGAISYRF